MGDTTFYRGKDYYERGKVLSFECVAADQIVGTVAGTCARPYSVTASFELGPSNEFVWLSSECTCPMARNCKHVAALLLAAQSSLVPIAIAEAKGVPREIGIWLGRRPKATRDIDGGGTQNSVKTSSEHLFYVFGVDYYGRAEIRPYKAYLKMDGTIGRNAKEYWGDTPARKPRYMTFADVATLAKLDFYEDVRKLGGGDWPEGEECLDLIRTTIETGRARGNDIQGARLWWGAPRRVELAWSRDKQGVQHLVARGSNGAVISLLPFPVPIYIDPETGESGVAESELAGPVLGWLASAPPAPEEACAEVALQLAELGADVPLPTAMPIEERTSVTPQPLLKLYARKKTYEKSRFDGHIRTGTETETEIWPCARLEFVYEGSAQSVVAFERGDIQLLQDDRVTIIRRDLDREIELQEALEEAAAPYGGTGRSNPYFCDPDPEAPDQATLVLHPVLEHGDVPSQQGARFTSRVLPRFRSLGWLIETDKTWPFHTYEGPVGFSTSAQPLEDDWFSFSFDLEADGQTLDLTDVLLEIIDAMPLNERGELEEGFDILGFLEESDVFCYLEDGRRVLFDIARLVPFIEAFLEVQGLVGFHRAEAGRVAGLVEALEGSGAPWRGGRELLDFGKRLRMLADVIEAPLPKTLHADLRPYQKVGFGWLKAVYDSGFGGVLADDMGLGKTVQTLALLADRHLEQGVRRPSLVIVPTSLIGTWRREAARFTPKLKLLVLHGPDRRQRFTEIDEHHLVITTYPLVNRDHEALFEHEYEVAVLDEAQWVKNPAAGVSKRIRGIRARQRLALTGTPLENNLLELWSLFDWLVPGLLGNRKGFTSEYRTPIEKRGDIRKQRLLSTRIKPFLLRRTKEQVAKELPKKTVIEEIVPLEGSQARLYESIRSAMDERVRNAIAEKGLAASSITILDALLKLRQVCCDPELVKLDAARKVKGSAKRDRLLAVLEELVSEGRRILVFSQFVSMLKLIEADVVAKGWEYAMLHGGTKDRDHQIQQFQSGELPIFLISLKAGGTGLNLTAADTVVLYDPWWNPAVERQAMDRTHRIGQDKPVFVYRLIAENTVESAIAQMQLRKQSLADTLFEGTGDGPLSLTEEDIDALFVANPN